MTSGGLDPDPPDPGARVDVEAIRARAKAATPGPWEQRENREEGRGVSTVDPLWPGRGHDIVCLGSDGLFADLAFIAHARADVPALCNALTHERRVSAIWRDLALARIAPAAAFAQLRALGIDPEGP